MFNKGSIKEDNFFLRNFLKIAISLNKENALQTRYLSTKSSNKYFVLIEELQKQNKNIDNTVKTFLSLIKINQINFLTIDLLLKIIKKDRIFVVQFLIENKLFSELIYYVNNLFSSENESSSLEPFSKAIKNFKYDFDSIDKYITIISYMISYNKNCCNIFFEEETDRLRLEQFILTNYKSFIRNYFLIANYALFLNEDNYFKFEKELIPKIDVPHILLYYSKIIEKSDKRLILKRLVDLGQEDYLVLFIRNFPQYKHLLLML